MSTSSKLGFLTPRVRLGVVRTIENDFPPLSSVRTRFGQVSSPPPPCPPPPHTHTHPLTLSLYGFAHACVRVRAWFHLCMLAWLRVSACARAVRVYVRAALSFRAWAGLCV
jgi:hypothetical protein